MFIVSSSRLPEKLREFANDLGVEFDADETSVIDHFNFDAQLDAKVGGGAHTVVVANHFARQPVFLGSFANVATPVLFKGYVLSVLCVCVCFCNVHFWLV